MPVVTVGSRASTEMVKAVAWGSWLFTTICGSANLEMRVGESGVQIRPLQKVQSAFALRWRGSGGTGKWGNGGGTEGGYFVPGVANHKRHLFGCKILSCYQQVAFIFTVGRVEDYDEVAILEGGDRVFY